ncbi:MAG TPA: DNA (cytosine-5-)-methyltransferase [Janthinobacterium sp.]|nr:DNA (cytosine-5-)-methyltransferase [Janthinobacterium sp.]
MKIDAVDLFCGAGGLSYGLEKAGITVRAGIDLDPHCEYPYENNIKGAKFLLKDVTAISGKTISKLYRPTSFKLLAGCAPCQPFSTLRNGTNRQKSDKWPLLDEFSRIVRDSNPDTITMENVPVLKSQSIFLDFVSSLKTNGYYVSYKVIDAADYGVPQRRRRLVLLASRHGPIRLLSPEEIGATKKTVRDAIGNLASLEAGQVNDSDILHKARALTDINLKRIKASKPGGTWVDWPENLKLECHKKEKGSSFKSVYGRLEWDKPSGTITTQATNFGTGRFGHPSQNRGLSIREMAILQSFPIDYKFVEPGSVTEFTSVCRLIGNAVPVELGYAVGLSISHHLHNLDKK